MNTDAFSALRFSQSELRAPKIASAISGSGAGAAHIFKR
jgi:hypothetical protein